MSEDIDGETLDGLLMINETLAHDGCGLGCGETDGSYRANWNLFGEGYLEAFRELRLCTGGSSFQMERINSSDKVRRDCQSMGWVYRCMSPMGMRRHGQRSRCETWVTKKWMYN